MLGRAFRNQPCETLVSFEIVPKGQWFASMALGNKKKGLAMDSGRKREKKVSFRAERLMVPFEEGNTPELEPLFAYHFELIRLNTDIFLDIGMIPPMDLVQFVQEYKEDSTDVVGNLKFYVLQRIV